MVEHKGLSNLLPPVRVCEGKFDTVKYSLLGRVVYKFPNIKVVVHLGGVVVVVTWGKVGV